MAQGRGHIMREMPAAGRAVERVAGKAIGATERIAGGPARFRVVFILASILALDAADKATLAAVTGSIEHVFNVSNAAIGLLIAVVSFVGAIGTLPAGVLIDRTKRRRLLIWTVIIWSIAEAVSGVSTSYLFLLFTRLALGGVVAAAFPAVASLTGDFFPARDRARMYGLILGGELVGTGVGFFISGELSAWFDWRLPFFVMAVLGGLVAWEVWRFLPEPARGGQSWIDEGQEEIRSEEEVKEGKGPEPAEAANAAQPAAAAKTQQMMLRRGVQPREELVLSNDPADCSLWWAVRYVLRIPTYLLLIISSSLAYYFFSGIRAFGMIYATGHYDVSRSTMSALTLCIGIAAIGGIVSGGALSEHLLARGWLRVRLTLPGVALAVSAVLFAPAIWFHALWIVIPLLSVAAFMFAASLPSIDAARLDIMHPRLWGRAEAGSMALRAVLEGGAPLLFGWLSMVLGGGTIGLKWTFLLMLVPLLLAAALAIPARRAYPRDVATAGESLKRTSENAGEAKAG